MIVNFVARAIHGERSITYISDEKLPDVMREIGNQIAEGSYSGRVDLTATTEVWWRIE